MSPLLAALLLASLPESIELYSTDRAALTRRHDLPLAPETWRRLAVFDQSWLDTLQQVPLEKLSLDGRIEYTLFRDHLEYQLRASELRRRRIDEVQHLVPFAPALLQLEQDRLAMRFVEAERAAAVLHDIARRIDATPRSGENRLLANRAALYVQDYRRTLKRWFDFYNGYDPEFSWWNAQPYKALDEALDGYARFLRESIAGIGPTDRDTIIGDPAGREALLTELRHEFIPYSPEELIDIANREFDWCEREMRKASRELGYGDDWKAALEHVKRQYMPPGKQPKFIHDLELEGEKFLEEHDLITIPELAKETWRMEMMTPERQRINPFFTGGEVLSASYPTGAMTHEQKMMSLRGNNIHFTRATVFHELIPGHHLQQFMNARNKTYRRVFHTPFWTEGWSLWWEMLLWDLGFQKTPENRVGALFWRMHRCARIIFSLSFHLGEMTAPEAVGFLMDRVGHERENAMAEVRRSVEDSSYGALYQCAYMVGALQFRALHGELVRSGKMTNRAFHDAVLKEHNIPIEMLRAKLTGRAPARDHAPSWRFYDVNP